MNASTLQLRAVARLHRQEDTAQAGKLRHVSLAARLLILVAVAVRLHMLTEPWHMLPDADRVPRLWLLMPGCLRWLSRHSRRSRPR